MKKLPIAFAILFGFNCFHAQGQIAFKYKHEIDLGTIGVGGSNSNAWVRASNTPIYLCGSPTKMRRPSHIRWIRKSVLSIKMVIRLHIRSFTMKPIHTTQIAITAMNRRCSPGKIISVMPGQSSLNVRKHDQSLTLLR